MAVEIALDWDHLDAELGSVGMLSGADVTPVPAHFLRRCACMIVPLRQSSF